MVGHLVQRLTVEVTFAGRQLAERSTPRLAEAAERLTTELEADFDEVAAGRTLRLERLELDLGTLAEGDLADLLPRLRRALAGALRPYRAADSPPAVEPDARRRVDLARPDAASLAELFEVFLRSGGLPWWFGAASGELEPLYRRFWKEHPAQARRSLQALLPEAGARQRLVAQFSAASLELTMTGIWPEGAPLLRDLRRLGGRLLLTRRDADAARDLSWGALLGLLAETEVTPVPAQALARRYVRELARLAGLTEQHWREAADAATRRRVRLSPQSRRVLAALLRDPDAEAPQGKHQTSRQAVTPPAEPAAGSVTDKETAAIPIANAGLVLLWPHLPRLLQTLELLDPPVDGVARPTPEAVLLLQQLVTGRPAASEPELLLNKLLCGLAPEMVIPRRWRRNVRWNAEVASLLRAVIGQWTALKSTSAAGLRSAFLQRDGLLRQESAGWLLQVERQSHDILLERLPWGLGMIRLSWMREPLRVEW